METQNKSPENATPAALASGPPSGNKSTSRFLNWKLIPAAIVVAIVIALFSRQSSHGNIITKTHADDLITVPVVKVDRETLIRSERFDAEFRPYQVIDLHAKVAGFVRSIDVDIGDHVKQGDLLATLEIPELTEDIEHAAATKQRNDKLAEEAAANYDEAHVTWTRLESIEKKDRHLVAQQDLDNARAKDAGASASLEAARENVKVAEAELDKLNAILNDCKITAPFSGVVTKRYADVGALVQGGVNPSGAAMPLVRLSENDRLRLDFPVSISFVHFIKEGDPVDIRISATGQTIHGKVSRFTGNVDMDTRTMETEVDVPNPDYSLTPGIYAEAELEFERHQNVLAVLAETVTDLKSPTAYVVNGEDTIEERPLKLGLTTADKIEIVSGLKANDLVMLGNRSQVKPGQKVTIKLLSADSTQ